MAVELLDDLNIPTESEGLNSIVTPRVAARVLTNKFDPTVQLLESDLLPGALPQTSTTLRRYAYESWLEARRQADQERVAADTHYETMALSDRVNVWAGNVMGFLEETIRPEDIGVWVEGFTALGFQPETTEATRIQAYSPRLGDFLRTDFYRDFCTAEESSAEAIAGSMVRHFIDSRSQEEREAGVTEMHTAWATMRSLFEQICDERTLRTVELILHAQTQRSLGNITPEIANEPLEPPETFLLRSITREITPRPLEEAAEPEPLIIVDPDALERGGEEALLATDEESPGNHLESEELDEAEAPDGEDRQSKKSAAQAPAPFLTAQRLRYPMITLTTPPHRGTYPLSPRASSTQNCLPPVPAEVAALAPVATPASRRSATSAATSVAPDAPNPSIVTATSTDVIKQEPRKSEARIRYENALKAYMDARAFAFSSVEALIVLRKRLQLQSPDAPFTDEYAFRELLGVIVSTLLTPEEQDIDRVDSMIQRIYTSAPADLRLLTLPLFEAKLKQLPYAQGMHTDMYLNAKVQSDAAEIFRKLPSRLAYVAGVDVNLDEPELKAGDVLTVMNALQAKGYTPMRQTIAGKVVAFTDEELAKHAELLAGGARGELALHIGNMFEMSLLGAYI